MAELVGCFAYDKSNCITNTKDNSHYRYWKVTFFMFWGGLVFTSGWIVRCVSSYHPANLNLYIAQYVLVLAGPPIYAAAEYNTLGRLMHYLPMHATLNPNRLVYFFVYLGAAVESLTAAGSARLGAAGNDKKLLRSGAQLVAIAVILQAVVECVFVAMVAQLHYRCAKAGMLTSRVRAVCVMLYGTSTLVLLRCTFRAVEKFSIMNVVSTGTCTGTCTTVLRHEWYIYAFEAAPMVLYTFWINVVHPGRFLPQSPKVFLDGQRVERLGPGWMDKRSKWKTFVDPFDLEGLSKGVPEHEKYWLKPEDFPISK